MPAALPHRDDFGAIAIIVVVVVVDHRPKHYVGPESQRQERQVDDSCTPARRLVGHP